MSYIKAVAIRLSNNQVFSLEMPYRHHDIFMMLFEKGLTVADRQGHIQGFLTEAGDFVDRKEAAIIAEKAGQLIRKTLPLDQLFSEDLW